MQAYSGKCENGWDELSHVTQVLELAHDGIRIQDFLPALEQKLESVTTGLATGVPTMEDIGAVLDTGTRRKELPGRRLAWLSQRVFNGQVCLVNTKIVCKSRDRFFSPVLQQIEQFGYISNAVNLKKCYEALAASSHRLDSVVINPVQGKITLVQSITYSRAKSLNKQLAPVGNHAPLFLEQNSGFGNFDVPANDIRSLLITKEMVEAAFPQLECDAAYVLMDDPDCSWSFESKIVNCLNSRRINGSTVSLDRVPTGLTSGDFSKELQADSDFFAKLVVDRYGNSLANAPFDRSTRCFLLLLSLWDMQKRSQDRIFVNRKEWGDRVSADYSLNFTPDILRHDVEDCLAMGSKLVTRRESKWGLTCSGIVMSAVLSQKLWPQDSFKPALIVDLVEQYA